MTQLSPPPHARQLDCLGKACPVPVIELAKAVATMDVGDTILVVCDDPGAKIDIPVWCRMKGQELVAAEQNGTTFQFTVLRTR